MQMYSNALMLIHANSTGMGLHIYFSIICWTINWLKARGNRTAEKRSDLKSSKAEWPDAVSVSISSAATERRR